MSHDLTLIYITGLFVALMSDSLLSEVTVCSALQRNGSTTRCVCVYGHMCVWTHTALLDSACPCSFHLLLLFGAVEVTLAQDARSISAAVMTACQPVSQGMKGRRHTAAERIGIISAPRKPLQAPCRINLMHFQCHVSRHRTCIFLLFLIFFFLFFCFFFWLPVLQLCDFQICSLV